MKKKKIWIAIGIAVVVVGIGGFAVVQSGKGGAGSAQATITAAEIEGGAKVTKGNLESNVYISGTVEANDSRSVSYMGGGLVDNVYVKEGDRVTADQVLVKINSDKLDSELKKMMNELNISKAELSKMKTKGIGDQEAGLKNAQVTYDNAKKAYEANLALSKSGAVSSDELSKSKQQMDIAQISLSNAQNAYDQAKANVDISISEKRMQSTNITINDLQKDIEKTVIKTPIAGTVTSVKAKEGEVLPNNGILLTIEDLDKKIVKAYVSENEINRISLGQKVSITGNSIKGKTFEGEVSYIAPGTIRQEGSKNVKVEVKITLKDNVPELRPGFNVNLEIETASRAGVLMVPFEAIGTEADGRKYVNVLEGEKGAEPKKVYIKTGVEGDIAVEVIDGDLKEGQVLQVITN